MSESSKHCLKFFIKEKYECLNGYKLEKKYSKKLLLNKSEGDQV